MQKFVEEQELLKANHPEQFAESEINMEKLRQNREVKLQKGLSEQSSILQTIEETHSECSKLLQQLKEQCSNLIKDGPKKFREELEQKLREEQERRLRDEQDRKLRAEQELK